MKQSIEKPDPQSETVHISERFRIARRNALVWSSATILAALATDACGRGIGLAFGMTGFVHHPDLIVVLALLVLGFMFAGFLRAEREIRIRNSSFAYGKSITEIAEAAQTRAALIGEANADSERLIRLCAKTEKEKSRELEKIQRDFELFSNDIVSYSQSVDEQLVRKLSHVDSKRQAKERLKQAGNGESSGEIFDRDTATMDLNRETRAANQAQNEIQFFQSEIKDRIDDQTKLIEQLRATFGELPAETKKPAKMEPEWRDLADQLSTLSNAIGNGDRLWLEWYDVRPVWILSGVAFCIAAVKLFAPYFITAVLNFAGFAVATAENCPT